jgi:glycine C-acetyltransferase
MSDATSAPLTQHYVEELEAIRAQGLFKSERIITSPQSAEITLDDGRTVLNFCANNYLGLADHPDLIQAAKDALDSHGFGMASVRFICGTQDLHKQLESRSPTSSARTTPSSMPPASMPTADCSNHCSARTTR